jgi:hypothetical protein
MSPSEKHIRECETCGRNHSSNYHLAKQLSSKGFPTHDPKYKTAHEETSRKEKAKFPKKDYERLKHLDEKIPKGELIGKNTKKGEIKVSKKVPKDLRKEVAWHEKEENKRLLRAPKGKKR